MTKPPAIGPAGKSSSRSERLRSQRFFAKIAEFFERAGNGSCQRSQVKAIRVVARFCICCFSLACAARIFFCWDGLNQALRDRRCDVP